MLDFRTRSGQSISIQAAFTVQLLGCFHCPKKGGIVGADGKTEQH